MPARGTQQLKQILRERFTTSYMSDAKWRKFADLVREPRFKIQQVVWKFVYTDKEIRSQLTWLSDNGEDTLEVGPFFYKEVEWVEVPQVGFSHGDEKVPSRHWQQDVADFREALSVLGEFEVVTTDRGVRVIGYR